MSAARAKKTTTPKKRTRCRWAESDPLMAAYHDEEWGTPEHDPRALWELLCLEGFQAGLSWSIILRKRDAFRRAFKAFDPRAVARMTERDVDRLMNDEGIVRARAKIAATIGNAKAYLAMEKAGEDFATFIWSFAPGGRPIAGGVTIVTQTPLSVELSRALKKKGFKFVGPVIVHAFLQAAGVVDDHSADCFRKRR